MTDAPIFTVDTGLNSPPVTATPAPPPVQPAPVEPKVANSKKKSDWQFVLTPNASVSDNTLWMLIGAWVVGIFAFWFMSPFAILPNPPEVLSALVQQWQQGAFITFSDGHFGGEMLSSLVVSFQSIFWATVIGLGLCYLSTIPIFRAPVAWIGKLRFLSLTGMLLVFILVTPNGHVLKVAVLTFAMVVFLVNAMNQVIEDIPQARFDHARTLGLGKFAVLREVVIRGTLDQAFESVRMNAAMAWMMLTMVEGLSRSEGGIGVLLLNLDRHMQLGAIFAIQLVILAVGIGQDRLIKFIKVLVCPYTKLQQG